MCSSAIQSMIKEKDIAKNQACYHIFLNTEVQRDIMQVHIKYRTTGLLEIPELNT